MKPIYLDYVSLTPINKEVIKIVKKYSSGEYTNPSALYTSAIKAKKAIEDARIRIAKILHAHADEIIFTSGGTESNQLVIRNFKENFPYKQIVISSIEHSSIIKNVQAVHIPVNKNGIIDLAEFKKSITPEVGLVSIMMVNNEIGTIEPIQEIAKIIRDSKKSLNTKIFFHVDACQAPISLHINVEKLSIDIMTLDGAKIYGPRGVGMLYVKRNTLNISRHGTENIPGIMGFTYALELAEKMREKETKRTGELKSFFINQLRKIIPDLKINGDINISSPHILNISIPNIDNEFFVLKLDAKDIECSTKSACLRDEDESYVLKAIGVDSKTSVRFSFGRETTKGKLKKVVKVIAGILNKD